MNNRVEALKTLLELDEDDIVIPDVYESNLFKVGNKEYLVLTEKEANEKARYVIEQDLWAFQPQFILSHNKNTEEMNNWEYDEAIQALSAAQSKSAEALNGLVRCLITDLDEFVEDAIREDGRGHFLANYDSYEEEQEIDGTTYYIYRTN